MKRNPVVLALGSLCLLVGIGCGAPTSPTPTASRQILGLNPASVPVTYGGLRIERAVVLELQHAGNGWHYAPQVRVTGTSTDDTDPAAVIGIDVHVPDGTVWICSVAQEIGARPDQPVDLFLVDAGEHPISFGPFGRPMAADWAFVVRFWDGVGRTLTITVTAPSTPASDIVGPASGGLVGGGWSCRRRV